MFCRVSKEVRTLYLNGSLLTARQKIETIEHILACMFTRCSMSNVISASAPAIYFRFWDRNPAFRCRPFNRPPTRTTLPNETLKSLRGWMMYRASSNTTRTSFRSILKVEIVCRRRFIRTCTVTRQGVDPDAGMMTSDVKWPTWTFLIDVDARSTSGQSSFDSGLVCRVSLLNVSSACVWSSYAQDEYLVSDCSSTPLGLAHQADPVIGSRFAITLEHIEIDKRHKRSHGSVDHTSDFSFSANTAVSQYQPWPRHPRVGVGRHRALRTR